MPAPQNQQILERSFKLPAEGQVPYWVPETPLLRELREQVLRETPRETRNNKVVEINRVPDGTIYFHFNAYGRLEWVEGPPILATGPFKHTGVVCPIPNVECHIRIERPKGVHYTLRVRPFVMQISLESKIQMLATLKKMKERRIVGPG